MSEFKVKSMRETFEENYKAIRVPARNKKGFAIEYVYVGKWYAWRENPQTVRTVKACIAASLAGSILLYLFAAVQNDPLNWSRLVSMTGLLSLAPLVFLVIGVIQFLLSKEKMEEQNWKDISVKLKIAPVFHGGLLLICGLAGITGMMKGSTSSANLWVSLCYLLSGAASLAIVFCFRHLHEYILQNE